MKTDSILQDAGAACQQQACSPLTDHQRWEALNKPEIICAECLYIGSDGEPRCCEICARDEPDVPDGEGDAGDCPDCKKPVWWVPKCPKCGAAATWTYGEIKPREFERITENK